MTPRRAAITRRNLLADLLAWLGITTTPQPEARRAWAAAKKEALR